ncbi:MAG: patatin-like phospholipase family protein [Bacteroidetes bacterium]|nr:patatin-like phospholipase family protein [Bacteroidota bacterium]
MPTENNKSKIPENEFHIGLTMAGAVSAGAYTAGVMDYLFETLQKWENAKNGMHPTIDMAIVPMHKVVIDAMGGASAGGMTTTMSLMALLDYNNYNPVNNPKDERFNRREKTNNILFDSWVYLNDLQHKESTFEQMFATDDLKDNTIASLFNTTPIEKIADAVFNSAKEKIGSPESLSNDIASKKHLDEKINQLPDFISKDLQMILSLCTLRGIPVDVNFDTITNIKMNKDLLPSHRMNQHRLIAQFKLNYNGATDENQYLEFNPYDEKIARLLKKITIATGAFPFGLKMRQFDELNAEYIKNITDRYLNAGDHELDDNSWNVLLKSCEVDSNKFKFTAIDGGTVNNEPFGEVVSVLNDKYELAVIEVDDKLYHQFAMIMIDPFPDFNASEKFHGYQQEIFSVIPNIYNTLRQQSLLKKGSSLTKYGYDYPRGMIFPKKNMYQSDANGNYTDKIDEVEFPIACASFGAFGGFLDFEFRKHDYFLGRHNCMNFLRYFFSITYNPDDLLPGMESKRHPIHKNWTQEMITTFGIDKGYKFILPIIPDMDVIGKTLDQLTQQRKTYPVSEMPKYSSTTLFKMQDAIEERLEKIVTISSDHLGGFLHTGESKDESDLRISSSILSAKFPPPSKIKKLFGAGVKKVGLKLMAPFIVKILSKTIIKAILTDLDKRKLLKD